MKKEEKNIGIVIGIAFLFLAIYLAFAIYDRYQYFGNKKVVRRKTIAIVVEIATGGKLASKFKYQFYANGKSFFGTESLPDHLSIQTKSELEKYIGKRYLVIYGEEKPKYSELLIEKGEIKNNLIIAPDTGWLEIERIPNYPLK